MQIGREKFREIVIDCLPIDVSKAFVKRIEDTIANVAPQSDEIPEEYKKVILWVKMFISEERAERIKKTISKISQS